MEERKLKISFYGGVDAVTGANFILHDGKTKIMVDCGIEQGQHINKKNDPNREPFKYNPAEIDYLFVTHAHADHIGRIPKLMKDGFRGVIYSTPTTREIVEVMFDDSLNSILDEAKILDIEPMYERKDVDLALNLWQTIPYHEEKDLNAEFSVLFKDAGHILGSAMIYIKDKKSGKNIVFTGDLGNTPTPLIRDTEKIDDADYLIMESVYGDRNHENKESRKEKLKEVLNRIISRKGTLLVPVFSLEKAQVLLHEMNDLIESGQVRSVPVFFDSPLGIRLTEIYARQFKSFNEKVQERIRRGDDIFDFPKLMKTYSKKESMEIHKINGPKIIIASSGMSVGGRIMEHERKYLPDPKNCILFLGYQAIGSSGRSIEEGSKKVEIDGEKVPVKAQIEIVSGYSSHMDSDHLLEFVANTRERLKRVFVVMGEPKASLFLAQKIHDNLDLETVCPKAGESYEIIL